MGAVAGAVLGAPISTILIIFELTSNFTLTIAVMIGVVIATVITQQVMGHSFFTRLLERRGISLSGGREISLLKSRHVADIMRADFEQVTADLRLPSVRARLQADPHGELFVVAADGSGRLAGTITLHDLAEAAFDTSRDNTLSAADVARSNPPAVLVTADLEEARRVIENAAEDQIAVVSDDESRRLVGYLRERDVMQAYQAALMQARAEERGEA
jgi:CIC family chloride channel protein